MRRLFLLLLLVVLSLSSCTLFQKKPDGTTDPSWWGFLYISVAESAPGFDAISDDYFFGYGGTEELWKIYWNDTANLQEGEIYPVLAEGRTDNKKATGRSPVYITTATSIGEKEEMTDFSTLAQVVSVSKVDVDDEWSYFNKELVSIYKDSISYYDYYNHKADPSRSIVLPDGTRKELVYHISRIKTFNEIIEYYAPDGSIECQLDAKTGGLLKAAIFDDEMMPLPEVMTSEENLHGWLEAWMSKLKVRDFSEYRYHSCTTYVRDSEKSNVYPYLYTEPKETEKVVKYTFEYARYVDGYPTSDTVSVDIWPDTHFIIRLGTQSFGDVESVSVDVEALMAQAEAFIRNGLNIELYEGLELLETEASNMTLRCCDGRLGMEIALSVRLALRDTPLDDQSMSVLIFLD